MSFTTGWGARARAFLSDSKGPWGSGGSSNDGSGGSKPPPPEEPKSPWGEPGPRRRGPLPGAESGTVSSLDDFLRRSRGRFGGGGAGGGFGSGPDRSVYAWALLGLVALWLLFTSVHSIAPEQRGVVTRFGRYSHTLPPGVGITLPSPIDRVAKVDVENIREITLGSASEETLMLTGDQNIIDIDYSVRWNIRDPELFMFELADPQETIRQVAESAMRAVIARVTLRDAMGDKRGVIEAQVMEAVQNVLDRYRAGVLVQGVAIKRADPPEAVNAAFKEVSAAQQDAQRYVSQANSYAQQLTFKAEGEAGAFDKVYAQYKLAPEVTRRRMYYETMEEVLRRVDKTIIEAPGVMPYLPLPQPRKAPPAAGAAQ